MPARAPSVSRVVERGLIPRRCQSTQRERYVNVSLCARTIEAQFQPTNLAQRRQPQLLDKHHVTNRYCDRRFKPNRKDLRFIKLSSSPVRIIFRTTHTYPTTRKTNDGLRRASAGAPSPTDSHLVLLVHDLGLAATAPPAPPHSR